MKAIVLAIAFSTATPTDVFAISYKLLPNLYAERYCNLRNTGVSRKEAIDVAVRENLVPGESAQVTIQGKVYSIDIIDASNSVKLLCPMYLTQ